MWFVYVIEHQKTTNLKPDGNRFYVGYTNNLIQRWRKHIDKSGADAIKYYGFKRVVQVRIYKTQKKARAEEGKLWKKVYNGYIPEYDDCSFISAEQIIRLNIQAKIKQKQSYIALLCRGYHGAK